MWLKQKKLNRDIGKYIRGEEEEVFFEWDGSLVSGRYMDECTEEGAPDFIIYTGRGHSSTDFANMFVVLEAVADCKRKRPSDESFERRLQRAREEAALAWCHDRTTGKEMDADLCEAFAEILCQYITF